MSSTEPTAHTYTIRYGSGPIVAVRGTSLRIDDQFAIVRDGDRVVGVYALATHSVTRLDAEQ